MSYPIATLEIRVKGVRVPSANALPEMINIIITMNLMGNSTLSRTASSAMQRSFAIDSGIFRSNRVDGNLQFHKASGIFTRYFERVFPNTPC
jgi:hypothetical protein